jgi:predicted AlkP superfamily pyrophosphatase or phosphodiesterase
MKTERVLPNYKDGSILNLMSSIGGALGWRSKYGALKILKPEELKKSKNIVLMVVDGLGYEYLMKYGKGSVFNENLRGKMTSTFPSSTSAAIPAFMTGTSPKEHGMTGWYMFAKEFGSQIIPLPYVPKFTWEFSLGGLFDINKLFDIKPFANKIKVKSYLVQNRKILDTEFTVAAAGKSKRFGYDGMKGYFRAIRKVLSSNKQRKFIFAYYSDHDSLCHKNGSPSKKVLKHFKQLDKSMRSFLKSIRGTDTTLIITADHGMADIPLSNNIDLDNHPKLKEMLSMPLSGEHRFAYVYVKPSRKKEFEAYVKTKLRYCCDLCKSEDFVKKGYFGLFKSHGKLKDRIGDYVFLMKDNYAIYDHSPYKEKHFHKGDHGGLSKEEMYVPLVVINN